MQETHSHLTIRKIFQSNYADIIIFMYLVNDTQAKAIGRLNSHYVTVVSVPQIILDLINDNRIISIPFLISCSMKRRAETVIRNFSCSGMFAQLSAKSSSVKLKTRVIGK